MGESYPIGITDSGKLFVHREVTTRDVALARIDLAVGRLLEAPKRFTIGFLENTRNPTWSPDGKYLAYAVKCNNGCLAIRTVATGEVRRLAPTLNDARAPRWSPDGRQLVVRGTHVNGQSGIFVVDVQTEETKAVAVGPGLNPDVGWSKDGKKIHFNRQGVLVEFDVATGSERDFFDLFQATGVRSADISPDGRHFAILGLEETPRSARLLLLPTEGGALREIFRFPQTDSVYGHVEWIPDSGAVLVQRYVNARWELWRIPVTAGVPTKLEIDPTLWRAGVTGEGTTVFRGDAGFSLSPDGRTVAIMIGTSDGEIRLLDVSVRP
jgi:dipeptidyl aminopeptidase/acylaminoacyl peptidase